MEFIIRIVRFVTRGDGSGRTMLIRLIGLIVIFVLVSIILRTRPTPTFNQTDFLPTQNAFAIVGTLAFDETVSGSIGEAERDAWQFEGESGQFVNLRVRGDLDSTLELIPPDGDAAIAIDFASGGDYQAFLCAQFLRFTGTYTAVVSGYLGLPDRDTGDYTLSLEPAVFEDARPLGMGERASGQTDTCDGDFFTIEVEIGDPYEIVVTPEEGEVVFARLMPSRTASEPIAVSVNGTNADGRAVEIITGTETVNRTLLLNIRGIVDAPPVEYTVSLNRAAGE